MVKKSKQQMLNSNVNKKKGGLLQGVLLWTLVPLLSTTMVLLIIAYVADINIFDVNEWNPSLPFVSKLVDEEEKLDAFLFEERVVSLQAEIQEKEAQLVKLEKALSKADEEKKVLLVDQKALLAEIDELKMAKEDQKRDLSEIISTFEKMSAKSVAPIISKMNDEEAIEILSSLKPDVLAPILEKLSAEDAARYTSLLTK
ncbi:hypothetical protein QTL97_02110 [Sporosarcina thermotolerans]|uniref:Magnesium transporter MgtE intracellular domain-containing protein n=1 Tax=Sporosarcina thermotolerans TaxID=633404 RepID=A0AAW9A4G9_9BACL|nr:hypothetical protein [Sporosarcina thermotolerans]MDW0115732.1 hypothetical protein [Sporosarcina thermotolerans]WHT47012.1 hypothetical protein QNH10_11815 [Sporosarcina thermotolerans]